MELRQVLRVLRRRFWIVAVAPPLAVAAAVILTAAMPRVYEARVGVLVRPAQPISSLDPNTAAVTAVQVASTYSELMTQRSLLSRVIADLRLTATPDQLAAMVSVAPEGDTTLLEVTVRDTDPRRARDIANRLVADFIAQTKEIQQAQVDQYSARVKGQVEQLRGQIETEQARITSLQAAGASHPLAPDQQTELANLQQQITVDRSQYFQILGSESDIELNVARTTDGIVIVSPATVPVTPVSPRPIVNVALALVGGLIVAIAAALLVDHLDQSIKTDAELTERTGLVPLAHVPMAVRRRRTRHGLPALGDDPFEVEPFKTLRTNVLFGTLDRPLSTIVVTSAAPAEGKSVVSANFAAALAAAGHRTLLLDCDFRRPSQHRLFGRLRNVGLSDLMVGDVAEPDVVLPVEDVPDLWLVTSGRIPPNPTELLGSERMRELLRRLQGRFSHIVIDTPPVNAVADALIAGSCAHAAILVVEHGRTSVTAVRGAVQALERVGVQVLGAVVNKVAHPEGHYAYEYRPDAAGDGAARDAAAAAPVASTARDASS